MRWVDKGRENTQEQERHGDRGRNGPETGKKSETATRWERDYGEET